MEGTDLTNGTVKTLVDSGGYSAWRLGKTIDLNAYCEFLEQNADWIGMYVVLDHIAPDAPEEAAQISFDNLKEMRRRGFNPIPIWHARESLDWIDRMLDLGCDYIGFSTTSARGFAIDDALELAWSHVVNAAGQPTVLVHAFGNSHVPTLFKYPWASADSSSWLRGPKWGRIMLHGIPTGRLNHRHTTKSKHDDLIFPDLTETLIHSNHARDISMIEGEDLDILREHVEALDIDLDELRENRKSRRTWLSHAYIAASFFLKLEEEVRLTPRPLFRPINGFVINPSSTAPAVSLPEFDLYMAVGVSPSILPALIYAGNRRPLASYYYINSHNHAARMRAYHTDPDGLLNVEPFKKYTAMLEEWIKPNV
jgi:hypothetical protein